MEEKGMRKKLIGLSIATALGIMSLTACKSQPAESASTNGAADTIPGREHERGRHVKRGVGGSR